MTINCGKLSGAFTRKITVETNDPDNPKMILTCKGKILEGAKVTPKVANFGKLSSTSSAQTQTLVITRGDGGPIAPKVRPNDNSTFSAQIKELEPGERYELVVTMSPPFSPAKARTKLEIETGVAEAKVVDVHAYAVVKPHVLSTPRHIIVSPELEGPFQRQVTLEWSDPQVKYKLTGVTASDPKWTAEVVTEDDKQYVMLTIPEGYTPPPGTHHLYIKTDDPKAPSVEVPVSFRRVAKSVKAPDKPVHVESKPKPTRDSNKHR